MTIDEVKEKIKNKEYPHVARLSEPYLTRLSELSLVVNDITYTAKIKDGVNVQGFMIYSSGLGIPVYEDLEKKNNGEFNGKSKLKESTDKARKWIDELEIVIAEIVNDNPIKKAIDRLNWQMHYDTTGVRTDLSTELAEFSQFEVTEDKPAVDMFETTVVAKTLTTTITDAAQEISIGSGGSSGGNLYKIAQNIYTLEQTMNRTLGTINTTFTTYDGNMKSYLIGSNESSIYGIIDTTNTSIKKCLTGGDSTKNIYSILENTSNKICVTASPDDPDDTQQTMWDALRGENGYSISAALRESDSEHPENNPKCVAKEINTGCTDIANKTETRTSQEQQEFSTTRAQITSSESNIQGSISSSQSSIEGNISNVSGQISGVSDTIGSGTDGTIYSMTSSLRTTIGVLDEGYPEIGGISIYNALFGHNFGHMNGHAGIIAGPETGGSYDAYWVRGKAPQDGTVWYK